jgi:glutamyl-Q tRNA(Asp) synthetase
LGESGQRHGELRYPGTCRQAALKWQQHATRFHLGLMINFGAVPSANIDFFAMNSEACRLGDMTFHAGPFVVWEDRRLGIQSQNAGHEVGDFVLRRADGTWAYQLAVVADDAAQGVTHVVRGEDLASNTARQIMLQRALNLPSVSYLHTPLVLAADGQKLSKQNGAQPLELGQASATLREALRFLGLQVENTHASVPDLLHAATQQWAQRFCIQPAPSSLTGC